MTLPGGAPLLGEADRATTVPGVVGRGITLPGEAARATALPGEAGRGTNLGEAGRPGVVGVATLGDAGRGVRWSRGRSLCTNLPLRGEAGRGTIRLGVAGLGTLAVLGEPWRAATPLGVVGRGTDFFPGEASRDFMSPDALLFLASAAS